MQTIPCTKTMKSVVYATPIEDVVRSLSKIISFHNDNVVPFGKIVFRFVSFRSILVFILFHFILCCSSALWARVLYIFRFNFKFISFSLSMLSLPPFLDKQQEFDLPSLRIDENEIAQMNAQKPAIRSRSPRFGGPPMSQISGVTRPLLSHTNSFTGERLPTFGVDTPHENALGTLLGDIDTWGIDIFKISELSLLRPLTSVAYTVFQVSKKKTWNFSGKWLSPQCERL